MHGYQKKDGGDGPGQSQDAPESFDPIRGIQGLVVGVEEGTGYERLRDEPAGQRGGKEPRDDPPARRGGRPSGKRSKKNPSGPGATSQIQFPTHAAVSAQGRGPG
jgi:hypothetical protein